MSDPRVLFGLDVLLQGYCPWGRTPSHTTVRQQCRGRKSLDGIVGMGGVNCKHRIGNDVKVRRWHVRNFGCIRFLCNQLGNFRTAAWLVRGLESLHSMIRRNEMIFAVRFGLEFTTPRYHGWQGQAACRLCGRRRSDQEATHGWGPERACGSTGGAGEPLLPRGASSSAQHANG